MSTDWKNLADLDPATLYFIPLGVGNAFTARYYHSSILLIADCKLVLIDAPAPLRRIIHRTARISRIGLEATDIEHVILTHLHGDHCNGIEEFGFMKKYLDAGIRPHLYLLPELEWPLWNNRLSAAMGGRDSDTQEFRGLGDFFVVHPVEPGRLTMMEHGPGLQLEFRRTHHSIPTAAMRITFGGVKLGYSADTPFDEELIEFLSPCDVIIHEATRNTAVNLHTPLAKLEGLPEEIRRKLRLIHLPDDLEQDETELELLREGELYTVEAPVSR